MSGTSGSTTSRTINTNIWYDGALQAVISYDSDINSGANPVYDTQFEYDGLGILTGVAINDGKSRKVAFTNDELGQIIRRDETRPTNAPAAQTGSPHEIWYRYGGRQLGYTGNNGTSELSTGGSIDDRRTAPFATPGTYRNGNTVGSSYADFAQSYDAVNSFSQGSAGGSYTVRAGETLQAIAQNLWGDANLWYKIAEANGMSGAASLREGQTLILPAGVLKNAHNAGTTRPYDPSEAIGDLSPTTPKPPKKNKCAVVGMLILAAVAIAVTAVVAGPASAGLANLFAGQTAATAAAAAGATAAATATAAGATAAAAAAAGAAATATALGTAGVAGAIAGGAIAGAAGSLVSQGLGVATGIQDKFSFKGVALAALGGAIGGAMGPKGLFGQNGMFGGIANATARSAATGAASSAVNQGLATIVGLQSKFSFAGLAAASVAGAVNQAVGGNLPALRESNVTLGNIARHLGTGTASLMASAATRSAIDGSNFGDNVRFGLADVLAQVVVDAAAGAMARERPEGAMYAQLAEGGPDSLLAVGNQHLGGFVNRLAIGGRTIDLAYEQRMGLSDPLIIGGPDDGEEVSAHQFTVDNDFCANPDNEGKPYYEISQTNGDYFYRTCVAIPRDTYVTNPTSTVWSNVRGDVIERNWRGFGSENLFFEFDPPNSSLGQRARNMFVDFVSSAVGSVTTGISSYLERYILPPDGDKFAIEARQSHNAHLSPLALDQYVLSPRQRADWSAEVLLTAATARLPFLGRTASAAERAPEFDILYRGDATRRTNFLSDVAQTRGVSASDAVILNAERRGSVSSLFEDHALTSQGSPFISLSSSEEVAQHFARGTSGDQAGFVTVFRVPRNSALPNFENPIPWEREYLAPTQIDPRYILRQYPVRPK